MLGRGGMERIPGGQDGEPSADEEARTPAPLGEGRPLCGRVGAGLATAAAIVGLATVALAYGVAPWHRAAAILSGHPQQQGHKGTKLFHSMEEDTTKMSTWEHTYEGSDEIYVENAQVFNKGDKIVILDPSGDSSKNEEGVIKNVESNKLILEAPVSKSLADGSVIIVQSDAAPAPGPSDPVNGHPSKKDYDCNAGYSNWAVGWSDSKKKACCQSENKGCTFDCSMGLDKWESGWSPEKKKFCCYTEQKGCDQADEDFDCGSGYDNWVTGWSEQKKKVCCATEGKGCTFDCSQGYSMWSVGWSEEKKKFCCESEQKGCDPSKKRNFWAGVWKAFSILSGVALCVLFLVLLCFFCSAKVCPFCPRACQNFCAKLCSPIKGKRPVRRSSGRRSTGSSRQGVEWIFKPQDDQPVFTLEEPNFDSAETGFALQPRERFFVIEEVDLDGNAAEHFLRLANGRGWCLDREPGHDVCYKLFEPVDELWRYHSANVKPIAIRYEPDYDADRTGEMLTAGEKFVVSEVQADEDGVLWLLLADGRGWVFDEDQEGYLLCKKLVNQLWEYQPENGKALTVRQSPDFNAEKTEFVLQPGTTFQVEETDERDGILYLKMVNSGWVFDQHPEFGTLCHKLS